ncbi:uncharacterized protein BO97DRAFT_45240 [Aspergillus homomorphus CBS 101889]|uniref:Hydrophobin n=1 Tax=Aspergillus homomorphus (strain CBS 101889) TaxID=1450537 RepID=A0A395HZI6_ASPHC|nr:hypothetical protein BO97DRAFT_45240 [Aspergillus homomorphus CBS 101889]RAL13210.1 hypothetical protein BO97DRAFT_45240 [Aspergillus homomorphus CBS 101889]
MQLKSLLLTLATTLSLATADLIEYCPFAQDKTGMLQHAYCCDRFESGLHTDLAVEGFGCQSVTEPVAACPDGGSVVCCYTINTQFICTANAILEDD